MLTFTTDDVTVNALVDLVNVLHDEWTDLKDKTKKHTDPTQNDIVEWIKQHKPKLYQDAMKALTPDQADVTQMAKWVEDRNMVKKRLVSTLEALNGFAVHSDNEKLSDLVTEALKSFKAPTSAPKNTETAAIRAWAGENGITLNSRGRIPESIVRLYKDSVNAVEG